jgi:hypothetical protein
MLDEENLEIVAPIEAQKYYAYYQSGTGALLAVTNEIVDRYETGIEIPYFLFSKVSSDQEFFKNWIVTSIETPDGTAVLELMPKAYQSLSFNNSIFEWINSSPTDRTDLLVTWDSKIQHWIFSISDNCKHRLLKNDITVETFVFFVVLESDFDFLIRTIFIKKDELMNSDVYIPFTTTLETSINKIAIASRAVFPSYALRIINE